MTNYTMGDWLLAEVEKRGMSVREFAAFIGVAHTTLNRLLDYGTKDVGYPSVDLLFKLARATKTDISQLMRLLDASIAEFDNQFDAQTHIFAGQFQQLSARERHMVEVFMRSITSVQE